MLSKSLILLPMALGSPFNFVQVTDNVEEAEGTTSAAENAMAFVNGDHNLARREEITRCFGDYLDEYNTLSVLPNADLDALATHLAGQMAARGFSDSSCGTLIDLMQAKGVSGVDLAATDFKKRFFFAKILHESTMIRRADGWPEGLCLDTEKQGTAGECADGWTWDEARSCCASNCQYLPYYYDDATEGVTKLKCLNDGWEINNRSSCCRLKRVCVNPPNVGDKYEPRCKEGSGGWKCRCVPEVGTASYTAWINGAKDGTFNHDALDERWWYDAWTRCCVYDDGSNTMQYKNDIYGKGMAHVDSFDSRYNNDDNKPTEDLNNYPYQNLAAAMFNWRVRYAARPAGERESWHWYGVNEHGHDHREFYHPSYPRDPTSPQFGQWLEGSIEHFVTSSSIPGAASNSDAGSDDAGDTAGADDSSDGPTGLNLNVVEEEHDYPFDVDAIDWIKVCSDFGAASGSYECSSLSSHQAVEDYCMADENVECSTWVWYECVNFDNTIMTDCLKSM